MHHKRIRCFQVGLSLLTLFTGGFWVWKAKGRSDELERRRLAMSQHSYLLTQLRRAAENGNLESVKALLSKVTPAEARKQHLLDTAARTGQSVLVQWLLNHGWDVNDAGALGDAVCYGHVDMVRLLLRNGAKVDIGRRTDYTPLLFATARGNTQITKILLDAGADINAPLAIHSSDPKLDFYDWTPLMLAVRSGYLDTVKLLLTRHADVNHKAPDGKTALNLAKQYKYQTLVQMLELAGAKE